MSRDIVTMLNEFGAVCEFMDTAGQEVRQSPIDTRNLAAAAVFKLRRALIIEEVGELAAAIAASDAVETLDALIDILYVTWGAYAALGLRYTPLDCEFKEQTFVADLVSRAQITEPLNMTEQALNEIISLVTQYCDKHGIDRAGAFQAIHDNNMTKFCTTQEEAEQTVQKYTEAGRVGVHAVKKNNKYVIRDAGGKVLKSINYKPVVLRV
jgi:predicted HAD superfamily Cof-like phosphohydrolase